MDRQSHARNFVLQTGLAGHEKQFADSQVVYLAIESAQREMLGYFILVNEGKGNVEFRRILIDAGQRGVGQLAIGLMENWCRQNWQAHRIWLDVFEDNARGIHIYEKLGYQRFGQAEYESRVLYFYEKHLEGGKRA